MRNYKLTIQYDGTNFNGWQRLPGESPTIQGTIEHAISQVIGYKVTIDGSGRTDAGVHAMAQIANMQISGQISVDEFCVAVNKILPNTIVITEAKLVKNSFHSRYNAKGKTYIYKIDVGDKANVFTKKYTHHYTEKIDLESMIKAAGILVGTHDFTSFSDNKVHNKNTRTIHSIDISKENNIITCRFTGDGFLNHMVRILTGTLLEVGSGQIPIPQVQKILESKSRSMAGKIAPAKGLMLEKVQY